MNLGFDFDKVFIKTPPLVPDAIIDRLYKKRTTGALQYRIPSKPEQLFRILAHHPLLRPLIKENVLFIQNLSKKKQHRQFLISSRFSFLKKNTEKLTKKHKFNEIFDDMFFNFENKQPHLFKQAIITKLKIDRYVDDDLSILEFLNKKNKKTKFFWLNNSKEKIINDNLIAITHLSKMLE